MFAALTVALAVLSPMVAHVLELRSIHTYHLSASGDDALDGASPATAWRSLEKANAITFKPGDRLLLEGGGRFRGTVSFGPGEAGDASSPVVVGTYGVGRATIESAGSSGIYVYNTAGIEIRDLVIVGDGAASRSTGGINLYSDFPDGRKLDHVDISGVEVSGFKNGVLIGGGPSSTGFRDVRIRNCVLHGNVENGLISLGPSFVAGSPRYAHEAVVVSGVEAHHNAGDPTNRFTHTGSGIVLGSVRGGRVERSSAHDNGSAAATPEGPVGIWAYDSTAMVIEHNVSFRNRTGGWTDGGGFDLDQNVSSSVLQYNLSYDNDGAGYMLYSGQSNHAFTGNIVRFNISSNDARKLEGYGGILLSGSVSNTEVYHNTVVMEANGSIRPPAVRLHKLRNGQSNIVLRNNLFVSRGTGLMHSDESSTTQVLLQGNNFFGASGIWAVGWGGASYSTLASWRAASGQEHVGARVTGLSVDPRFVRAEGSGSGTSRAEAFLPRRDSPLAGHALDLRSLFKVDPGPVDFFGRPVAGSATIGAVQPAAEG